MLVYSVQIRTFLPRLKVHFRLYIYIARHRFRRRLGPSCSSKEKSKIEIIFLPSNHLSMGSQQIGESLTASRRPENVKICRSMEMFGEETGNATLMDNDGLEMDLQKVCKEEIPYHARIYPRYFSTMENFIGGKLVITDVEDILKETTDKSIAKIRRACTVDEEYEISEEESDPYELFRGEIIDHRLYHLFITDMEGLIDDTKSAITHLKIFYIRDISLNTKPNSLSWSAKFQSVSNKIELEIDSHEKDENGTSQTKIVDFRIDPLDCNKPLTASFDDFKVEYSLFTNAFRVGFEIRPYNDDGNPILNVNGYVLAKMFIGGVEYEEYLFRGNNKYEKSERISESDNRMICPAFILSRGICSIELEVSLNDSSGKFMVNKDVVICTRSVATDEQHYILGKQGYIILTTIWACLCVYMGKGVCTCPGSAIGSFAAENTDSGEDTEEDESIYYTACPIPPLAMKKKSIEAIFKVQ